MGVEVVKTVLIVDDAAFMRLSLKTILSRNDFQVVGEAENGQIALEQYLKLHPDIVTMDITMPEMDGIAALKEIIKMDRNAKVVMITAMGQEGFVKEAIVNGAKTFIVKPFSEEHIVKALSAI